MVKLYLNKELADIQNNIDISLNYEMNDLSNPQAVKSSYSKTVKLEGTPNNNKIFSHIYKLDKEIVDDNSNLIGVNFNPNIRVPYYIENNGEIIDSGYFHLDNITSTNNNVQYNITLYGGIGDFFYNLMYDEEEEDKTLGSLYYGINGMSKEEEDINRNLFEYNKDFIKECWKRRIANNVNTNSQYEMFCPIPSHSGLYDDFNSSTVLTNEDGGISFSITEDEKTYEREYGFAKVTAPRELSEWEIGDLRSHYQRLGVKLKPVYEAIKNPVNNGGYTVDDSKLDDYSREYINNGYIMLDRFDYDVINETNKQSDLTFGKNPLIPPIGKGMIDKTNSQKFDLSDYVNPHLTVSIVPQIKLTELKDYSSVATIYSFDSFQVQDPIVVGTTVTSRGEVNVVAKNYGKLCFGSWQVYYVRMYDKDNKPLGISKPIIFGSYSSTVILTTTRSQVEEKLLKETVNRIPELNNTVNRNDFNWEYYNKNSNGCMFLRNTSIESNGMDYVSPQSIKIETALPKECTHITLEAFTVGTSFVTDLYYSTPSRNQEYSLPPLPKGPVDVTNYNRTKDYVSWCRDFPMSLAFNPADPSQNTGIGGGTRSDAYNEEKMTRVVGYVPYSHINNTTEDITQVYDGTVSISSKRHVLDKQQIFLDTDTPFDYLISLGKTFNWIFEKDIVTNTIRIYSKYNYYDKIVKDITYDVDRNNYTIEPSSLEYNKYLFNVPLPDTYQTELFKKKNNRIYSQFVYKPNYQFSSESLEVLNDTKFTLGIPYQMHSIYFTPLNNTTSPKVTLGNVYTVTLWEKNGDSTIDKIFKGRMLTTNKIVNSNDASEKICCFDRDNSNVGDMRNVFVFYNGVVSGFNENNSNILYLSDDFPLIDRLCDSNAYVITQGQPVITSATETTKKVVQDKITAYPNFTNTSPNGFSLSFNEENEGNRKNLWYLFFKNDFTNIYNKNSKVLKIKYRLLEQPQNALRHFYYLDNSYWILNKITDYKPNEEGFVNCEFIKVTDVNTFCKPEI